MRGVTPSSVTLSMKPFVPISAIRVDEFEELDRDSSSRISASRPSIARACRDIRGMIENSKEHAALHGSSCKVYSLQNSFALIASVVHCPNLIQYLNNLLSCDV